MAKKKTATKSKATTRSKASSKKSATKKAVRSKATTKKTASKKAAVKKAPAKKKTAAKKTAKKTTKKAAVKKKAPARKAATRKKTTKKAASKKAAVKKAPAKKKTAAKKVTKKAAIKKAPKKAATKKATKTAAPKKPKKAPTPKAKDERHTLTEARAAASGLAARAGIKIIRSHTTDEPETKSKTRRLKKSPLSKAQLDKYREILLLKRAEVAGDVSAMESEVLNTSNETTDQADQGSEEYEQALSLGLAESQRRLLTQINEALSRINNGTYGICSITGGPIGRERLDATPWTTLSLEGARERDRQNYYQ